MCRSDFTALRDLLAAWNLKDLFQHFRDEAVNIDELQLMKPHHVAELLRNYKMGIRIRFEHHLAIWRRNLNLPLANDVHYINCSPASSQSQNTLSNLPAKKLKTTSTNTTRIDLVNQATNTIPELPTLMTATVAPLPAVEDSPKYMPKLTPQPKINVAIKPDRCLRRSATPTMAEILPASTEESACNSSQNKHAFEKPLTLAHILESSGHKATALLDYYKENQSLTNVHRVLLIHMIVGFFEDNDYHLSLNMSHNIEYQILKMFPNERLENYRTEKRGRIYVKFCNMKRYKRDRPTAKRRWDGSSTLSGTNTLTDLRNESELVEANIAEDEDEDLSTVFDNWMQQQPDVQVKTESTSDDGY